MKFKIYKSFFKEKILRYKPNTQRWWEWQLKENGFVQYIYRRDEYHFQDYYGVSIQLTDISILLFFHSMVNPKNIILRYDKYNENQIIDIITEYHFKGMNYELDKI